MEKQKEVLFFDKFGNIDYDVFCDKGYNRILKEFEKLIKPKKGETLLDFGCGTGAFTKRLKKYNLNVVGIDISPKCVEYAARTTSGIHFITGDIEKTSLENDCADIVVFSGVLHHFEDFSKTLKEAHRVLKKGGRIFAYDPNKYNPVMWLYRDENSPLHSKKGRTDNERLLTIIEIKNKLRKERFNEIKVFSISGVTFKYVESRIGKLILPVYNLFETLLGKLPFSKQIGSFIITYAKK